VSALVVAVIGLSLLIGFGGCPRPQAAPRHALMVYSDYQPDLQPLGDYLQAHNLTVSYCNFDALPASYKQYGVIVIGPDTNNATAEQVAALDASGKPMIGIGIGGYECFGELGLEVGFPHGAHSSTGYRLRVQTADSPVFTTPNDFDAVSGVGIPVYEEEHQPGWVGIYVGGAPLDDSVTILATTPESWGYSPFIVQDNHYILWGFYELDHISDDGYKLFDNAVEYLLKQKRS
jgi:hypothetical protein